MIEENSIINMNKDELGALHDLMTGRSYSYSPDSGVILCRDDLPIPTYKDIVKHSETFKLIRGVSDMTNMINSTIDSLTNECKVIISGGVVSGDQYSRYASKGDAARRGDATYFKEESAMLGLVPTELMNIVLIKANAWSTELDRYYSRLEAVRLKLTSLMPSTTVELMVIYCSDLKRLGVLDLSIDLNTILTEMLKLTTPATPTSTAVDDAGVTLDLANYAVNVNPEPEVTL